ncbi:MAG TPA: DUF134 domain-containing protein [Thermoanaerobacterales bacterium]|nr:DUF134 domain-containing protein [Thermoanaerobacterales bacterium]
MARPRKWKRVCKMPELNTFGPYANKGSEINIDDTVEMTVEEFETIRMIDLEGLTQEQCGERMQVARSTVQRLYETARKKLADSLVNGKVLTIKGGDYKVCSKLEDIEICSKCMRHRHRRRGRGI